jgi:tRNA-specific 2-thiouridylase
MPEIKDWNLKLLPPLFSPWRPTKEKSRQIAVLMSGGVDSSVTAHLLRQQGRDVLGITMKIPSPCAADNRGCCGADAAFVANELQIPHYFIDVTDAFREMIVEPFRKSYENGQTPNPCVDCNTFLKFSLIWDFVRNEFGIEHLATGHYARVVNNNGHTFLCRAKDRTKDQSYFLYGIEAKRLAGLVLPLGEITKSQVRSIAAELDLSVAEKAESMELCFAGEGDYRIALPEGFAEKEGDITDMRGNKIGTHKGIRNYTIGQRRGVGFAGGKPLYVGKIDPRTNTISLGTREEVCCKVVKADSVNVLIPEEFVAGKNLFGKVRSYSDPLPCKVVEANSTEMTVEFEEAIFAPTPGQRLVLYDGEDSIVSGGIIIST